MLKISLQGLVDFGPF